ncbi:MAG: urease subunit beta [Candidatus Paralactobacillus gallistercoris]|uniref:Urease subunit beta n=1 Tax=Candidatus Paralactobacillus gallistercoris TaxID=2838724 RepID=A0A948TKE7_9LACO|nr:urease subunit beta [Candidatus Paralactobacillus gallistercoris]
MVPGEFHLADGKITCNAGYKAITLEVKNVGDRAVQVGSHFHFYEANEAGLQFDRDKAWGKRLDIPAGTAVRFEPGDVKKVNLVDFGGKRRIFGFNDKVNGFLDGHKAPSTDKDAISYEREVNQEEAHK